MIRSGWHVLWLALAIILAALAALQSVGVAPGPLAYLLNFQLYILSAAIVLGPHLLINLWRERPDRPIGYTLALLRTHKDIALRALPLLTATALFMPTFSAMKSAIPLFNEYSWDATFIAWDAALHGGDPWRLMQSILGFPIITAALAVLYHVWLLLIYPGVVYFAVYVRDSRLVLRYFTAFFLIWSILGIALAIWFASVGPVFLEPITGNPRFVDQVEYLRAANDVVPILVLPVQEQLLGGFLNSNNGLGRGITAMPSMHVALAFLFWLATRHINVTLSRVMFGFMLIILIGSVHLAYHYAVDGYVSIVLTLLVWKASAYVTPSHSVSPDRGGDFDTHESGAS